MLAMKHSVANTACAKHYAELDAKLNKKNTGVHTHTIKGRPNEVHSQMNMFYSDLTAKYGQNGWRVVDTASHPMPSGVCLYITYEIL